MGKAGDGYIFAGGDFQRTYPMTGVLRYSPSTTEMQIYYNGWKTISVGGGGGGSIEYTEGTGIDINNYAISVDTEIIASKEYVDGIVGDINSVLDEINGEVI